MFMDAPDTVSLLLTRIRNGLNPTFIWDMPPKSNPHNKYVRKYKVMLGAGFTQFVIIRVYWGGNYSIVMARALWRHYYIAVLKCKNR